MAEGKQKVVPALLVAALVLAAVPALVQLGWHARLFLGRASYPLDLEWMEGGMLVHALRLAQGKGIYVAPSVEFIPFLYTPLYPAVLALLSYVFPLGYLLGRVVSIVSFGSALAVLVVATHDEGRGKHQQGLALLVGVAGAGVVAASFAFTGYFYDLVRGDSLLLALEAATLLIALRGRGWRSAALAGLCIALAFFAKQTATIVGIGIGVGLLVANWRRGLVYGAVAAVALGLGIGLLVLTSGGWFWTYIFKLHQSHAFRWEAIRDIAWPVTQQFLWPLYMVLIVATVGLALSRKLQRSDAILWAAALAGEIAALVGFATQWADSNAFIPAVYFPAFAAVVLVARLALVAFERRKWGGVAFALVATLLFGAQSLHTLPAQPVRGPGIRWPTYHGWPRLRLALPARDTAVPSLKDRVAARRLLHELRALPSPLFIPFHTWYAVLAGKQPFVHRMGVRDVESALGRPQGLDDAFVHQQFAAIVLDWKSFPGEWPHLDAHYRLAGHFTEGQNSVRMFAGAQTWPDRLFVPRR